MKVFHFYENNREILHRLQETTYSINDPIRLKGRNGKILSVQAVDKNNVIVSVFLEPKKPKFIPIDLKKLRRH